MAPSGGVAGCVLAVYADKAAALTRRFSFHWYQTVVIASVPDTSAGDVRLFKINPIPSAT
jgi:hypothetical protein